MQVSEVIVWVGGIAGAITACLVLYEKTGKKITDSIAGNTRMCEKLEKKHDQEIKAIEQRVEQNEQKLLNDYHAFQDQHLTNKLILKSISVMVKHMQDDNHTGELRSCAKEIDEFLIDQITK
ncbi:hypothetical protein [Dubosiella newyorkensis]|nr:hypothetical protein [Dubosiella newyorkensis]